MKTARTQPTRNETFPCGRFVANWLICSAVSRTLPRGADMSDIQVGVVLLEYADRLSAISQLLMNASATAHEAVNLLTGDEGFYDGEARPEMKLFYESYAANIDKLLNLESVGAQYLRKVFDDFVDVDDQLAVVQAWLEGAHP